MPENDLVICPDCQGTGTSEYFIGRSITPWVEERICEFCDGTGYFSRDRWDKMRSEAQLTWNEMRKRGNKISP